jgi:putative ABC transport system permease protein
MKTIPLTHLALSFIPPLLVIGVLHRWSLDSKQAIYGLLRMLVQLLLIGYVLIYIFEAESAWIVALVLCFMLMAASWISLRPVRGNRRELFLKVLASIAIGGVSTLILVTQFVLKLDPRWVPSTLIPLGGMIFANAMNCVSLAAERFQFERDRGMPCLEARHTALRAALIPLTNSLFSVGIVSLPGMMTGQILSGVSPLIAARYQIMVMCMVFGAGGISAICFLWFESCDEDSNDRS